jgi:transcriptional regulator with XRE-family HTH domain
MSSMTTTTTAAARTPPPAPSGADRAGQAETGPGISRQRLGAELLRYRLAAGLRLTDAAAELGVATSTLSRIETGRAPTRTSYLTVLLSLYQVDDPDQRATLTDLARRGQRHDWWADKTDVLPPGAGRYLGLETGASRIRTFAFQLIPDLLQHPAYTAAVIRLTRPRLIPAQATALAGLTVRRQELLRHHGTRLHAILDETALRRPPGTPAVMTSQLRHLAGLAGGTAITLQVLPIGTPWPAVSPAFTLLNFPDAGDAETACTLSHDEQHLITTHRKHTQPLARAFTALSRAALPPDATARLITSLLARTPAS